VTFRTDGADNITPMTTTLASEPVTRPPAQEPSFLELASYGDRVFRWLLTLGALTIPILLGFLVFELWQGSRLAMTNSAWTSSPRAPGTPWRSSSGPSRSSSGR